MVAPKNAVFVNPLGVFLDGNGQANHVLNDQGAAITVTSRLSYVC